MDETGTLPSAGSSRFRFNGFTNLASQHDKSAHPEVKRFLTGKEEQCNCKQQIEELTKLGLTRTLDLPVTGTIMMFGSRLFCAVLCQRKAA